MYIKHEHLLITSNCFLGTYNTLKVQRRVLFHKAQEQSTSHNERLSWEWSA